METSVRVQVFGEIREHHTTKTRRCVHIVNLVVHVHIPAGLMVWCAMNGAGELVLRRCPPKVKAADYQAIVASATTFIKPRFGACF